MRKELSNSSLQLVYFFINPSFEFGRTLVSALGKRGVH
nr:MAG TPA: type VIII secretion system protein [Caudoviricetes sp.]DAX87288.1 MAG TPA: type VIII secretion system protein [Caudoviricetes sp.]